MKKKEDELKEIFLAEALESYEELNRLFTILEKDHSDQRSVEAIFRITHTLKANAAAMGYEPIAQMSHSLEDVFSLIKSGKLPLNQSLFNELFRANDKLGALIQAVQTGKTVSYRGLLTRLNVILRDVGSGRDAEDAPAVAPAPAQTHAENTVSTPTESKATANSQHTHEAESQQAEEPVEEPLHVDVPTEEAAAADSPTQQITFSDLVQIPVRKLDQLMNLVGELIIERDRLLTVFTQMTNGRGNDLARLQRISSDLQYSVMNARLVQAGTLFGKFHRIVRDVAASEGKKVDLILEGSDVEIDRNILQLISDALIHLVRNAISHGIEPYDQRVKAGKKPIGTLRLRARNDKEGVAIEVTDDGRGIDPKIIRKKVLEKGLAMPELLQQLSDDEVISYIFEAGFSSMETVTAISGRGVGMDVVRRAVDSIGGKIYTRTEIGKGTTFTLLLPASMAVKGALLFEIESQEFAVPLSYTEAVVSLRADQIKEVGKGLVFTYLDKVVSAVFLKDIFSNGTQNTASQRTYHQLQPSDRIYVLICSDDNRKVGLVVDKLLQQKEIVEKTLPKPLDSLKFFSGATILGNGRVCLVLDVFSIVNQVYKVSRTVLTT